ncbi:MAG: hypothetical protein JWM14_3257, partial [Chitinophagaceae bacterium]|nr:hypothetical protein [Chitinophagaceae bacterium]
IIVIGLIAIRVIYGIVKAVGQIKKEDRLARTWKPEYILFDRLKLPLQRRILELNNIKTEEEKQDFIGSMLVRSLESKNFSQSEIMDSFINSNLGQKPQLDPPKNKTVEAYIIPTKEKLKSELIPSKFNEMEKFVREILLNPSNEKTEEEVWEKMQEYRNQRPDLF